jgi:adenosine deaminase
VKGKHSKLSAEKSHPAEARSNTWFRALPKVDLHRHLEGALRLETMLEIARDHQLDLPWQQPDAFRQLVQVSPPDPFTFENFLSKFTVLRQFYRSAEIIERIVHEAVEDAAGDNIHYLELRFTPVALTRINDLTLDEAINLVMAAAADAAARFGIQVGLIVSVNRHESLDLATEVIGLAADSRSRGVLGVDLAGAEASHPGEEFAHLFQEARRAGLHITVHAGEWGGPEIVRLAIEQLGAERIGHGVRVLEDPAVTALAGGRGISFEVCPTSNWHSGVVRTLSEHPLVAMHAAGLQMTLNTDDPGISDIDLSNEYELACRQLGLTLFHLREMILNAADFSFLPQVDKTALRLRLERALAEHFLEEV